jgi:hypothetical protein
MNDDFAKRCINFVRKIAQAETQDFTVDQLIAQAEVLAAQDHVFLMDTQATTHSLDEPLEEIYVWKSRPKEKSWGSVKGTKQEMLDFLDKPDSTGYVIPWRQNGWIIRRYREMRDENV